MTLMYPSRSDAARMGQEALTIMRAGEYRTEAGEVDLRGALSAAVAATRTVGPGVRTIVPERRHASTSVFVENTDCLQAARRLVDRGLDVAVLNFASAKNPGGGFLSGARAQEESICRASGLFVCLEHSPMYEHHRQRHDPLYSTWVVHSPNVPVFREGAELLAEPWSVSFLSSPAPNAKVVLGRSPERRGEVEAAMRERIDAVFTVAAQAKHDALVLGAWGCGAFGNDSSMVAGLFADAVARWQGCFAALSFAILDSSPERRFIGPFEALATS